MLEYEQPRGARSPVYILLDCHRLARTSDLKHPEVHFLEILNGNRWKSCTDGKRFRHQFMSVDQTKSQYSLRGRRPVTVAVSNEVVAPKT